MVRIFAGGGIDWVAIVVYVLLKKRIQVFPGFCHKLEGSPDLGEPFGQEIFAAVRHLRSVGHAPLISHEGDTMSIVWGGAIACAQGVWLQRQKR